LTAHIYPGSASKRSARKAVAVGAGLLTLAAASSRGDVDSLPATQAADAAPASDFATVSKLINDAIAAQRLPGAVVVIGHGGRIVFHKAYGARKYAGEPGLDGSPAPAEPMTEDTIFDMASLTKCLATATAVMQLYEQGKVQFDDPVQKYLPDFNTANDPSRAAVTVRMLLTHTSGEPSDGLFQPAWHDLWHRKALATPALPEPRSGWIRLRIPT
jgi:CubicO group peptidase (beta-lactamase class C family)